MRLVVAVLRPAQLEAVRQALAAVHVTRLTICDAQGFAIPGRAALGSDDGGRIVQESVMEIAVNDDFLERTVDTIRQAMQCGAVGNGVDPDDGTTWTGRLFVLPIEDAVQIYREVRGQEAV